MSTKTAAKLNPLLRLAAIRGIVPTVELFVRRGENLDAADDRGFTPLMLAAMGGNTSVCKILLDGGADASTRNGDGKDVFDLAREFHRNDLLEVLETCGHNNLTIEPIPSNVPATEAGAAVVLSGDWEQENEPARPEQDDSCLIQANEEQLHQTFLVVRNNDQDWSDVDIDFSSIEKTTDPRNELEKIDPDVWQKLKKTQTDSLHDGLYNDSIIQLFVERQALPENVQNILKLMETSLSWVGICPDDYARAFPFEWETLPTQMAVDPGLARDIFHILKSDFSGAFDSFYLYEQEISKAQILPAGEQQLLLYQISQLQKEVLSLISRSSSAMNELIRMLDSAPLDSSGLGKWIDLPMPAEEQSSLEDSCSSADQEEADAADLRTSNEELSRPHALIASIRSIHEQMNQSGGQGKDPRLQRAMRRELERICLTSDFVQLLSGVCPENEQDQIILQKLKLKLHLQNNAKSKFVSSHLRLVVWVARRYLRKGLDIEDLVQEGNIGLLRAVEKFNPTLGNKFSTYAVWWIRQAVARSIADSSRTIRIPVHLFEKLQRVKRGMDGTHGPRKVTEEDFASDAGVSVNTLRLLLDIAKDPVPLESDDDDLSPEIYEAIVINAETEQTINDCRRHLAHLLNELTARERTIITLRFGLGEEDELTLEEVGARFGITRERVRQIEAKALRRLGRKPRIKALHGYLQDFGRSR
ncbi:MAG: sigma-70 family RNA polymerase sigma factor [Alphaproteobacteria bacterium]|nr:sigma-70 family RNA polymerase sigma factor [Alphaproteobacteria bacterium]